MKTLQWLFLLILFYIAALVIISVENSEVMLLYYFLSIGLFIAILLFHYFFLNKCEENTKIIAKLISRCIIMTILTH